MPRPHPAEFRRRAVELARLREQPITKIAEDLGISESCLRNWLVQAEVNGGRREGLTTDERAELIKLRREKRVLELEDPQAGVGLFRPGERPPKMTHTFIATCSDLPVEQCCRVMKVSRSAFFAWRHRQANPTARMAADVELGDLIVKIHEESRGTYGSPPVTAEVRLGLQRVVNHKRVERLMRERGLQGVSRRRRSIGCTRRNRAQQPSDGTTAALP